MPPAISDDENSEAGDIAVEVPKKTNTAADPNLDDDEQDNAQGDVVKADVENDVDEEEEDEEDEDMEDDVFVVEKILDHKLDQGGNIRYKVKWEGFEKKSDQTWEPEDNLQENASEVLDEYLAGLGGRDKIIEQSQAAAKSKKRGRPGAGTPTNGSKRSKTGHPASTTPPAAARAAAWKPPAGSWEEDVESIDACHDETTGKLIVYLAWKNGQKTQHDTKIVYQRCPQKMLQYYERHVKIVKSTPDE